MERLREFFQAHPREANQSYFVHMKDSLHYSCLAARATGSFFVHAFAPHFFQTRGGDLTQQLHLEIQQKRLEIANIQAPNQNSEN